MHKSLIPTHVLLIFVWVVQRKHMHTSCNHTLEKLLSGQGSFCRILVTSRTHATPADRPIELSNMIDQHAGNALGVFRSLTRAKRGRFRCPVQVAGDMHREIFAALHAWFAIPRAWVGSLEVFYWYFEFLELETFYGSRCWWHYGKATNDLALGGWSTNSPLLLLVLQLSLSFPINLYT